jgi:pimeloyl-ACP methyl ester carboxylesterase
MPTVRTHRARIYYEVHGQGPAVVLAHGAAGNTLSWHHQVPHLQQRHRVIAFDHRGFGRSLCDREDVDVRRFAGDLIAVLDADGIERAAIVGHDMGGMTAMRLALDHPDRVSCIVLVNTSGGLLSPRALASLAQGTADFSRTGFQIQQMISPEFARRHPERGFLLLQIASLNEPPEPSMAADAMEGRVRLEELAGFDIPTLLVAGEQDFYFPIEAFREVADRIPGAKLISFPRSGHYPFFEEPEEFNRVVGAFLGLHPGGSSD